MAFTSLSGHFLASRRPDTTYHHLDGFPSLRPNYWDYHRTLPWLFHPYLIAPYLTAISSTSRPWLFPLALMAPYLMAILSTFWLFFGQLAAGLHRRPLQSSLPCLPLWLWPAVAPTMPLSVFSSDGHRQPIWYPFAHVCVLHADDHVFCLRPSVPTRVHAYIWTANLDHHFS